jgi:hypothetical protein
MRGLRIEHGFTGKIDGCQERHQHFPSFLIIQEFDFFLVMLWCMLEFQNFCDLQCRDKTLPSNPNRSQQINDVKLKRCPKMWHTLKIFKRTPDIRKL